MGAKISVRSSGSEILTVEEIILEEGFLARIFFFFLAGVDGVDGGSFDLGKIWEWALPSDSSLST